MNAWPLDEGLIDYVDSSYGGPTEENEFAALNVVANAKFMLSGKEIDATNITPQLLEEVLHEADVTAYHERGFLGLESFVGDDWLAPLQDVTQQMIEESRSVTATNDKFDVEPDHTPAHPRLRRLMMPQDQHPVYTDFAMNDPIVDVAEDLLGPNLKFHHGKLNFKWSGGGAEIKWHQDVPFWPHTSYSVLTIGVALADIRVVRCAIGLGDFNNVI